MNSRRLTACGVTALLVILVPLAAAEGEYWKEPDTLTFPGGGSVAAGRVENLLENDGRTLKLSDTNVGPGTGEYYARIVPVSSNFPFDEEWDAHPDTLECEDGDEHFSCVDDTPPGFDGSTTYVDTAANSTWEGYELCCLDQEMMHPGDILKQIYYFLGVRRSNVSIDSVLHVMHYAYQNPGPHVLCSDYYFDLDLLAIANAWYTYPIVNFNALCNAADVPFEPFLFRLEYVCGGYVQPGTPEVPDIDVPICGPTIGLTSVHLRGTFSQVNYALGADLRVPATGYRPIRAEWTCTARTGGPYYLGALNVTGGTRWLNVTRDAGGSYPSGEMCAVPGATERYHAAMSAADFGPDGRVHFRIADNPSDPQGSAWGNITLDRLVAILTQDFAVSVGNLGWLVYLGFITVGILIAVFAFHRWREHGSGA